MRQTGGHGRRTVTGGKRLSAAVLFCVGLIAVFILALIGEGNETAVRGNGAAAQGSATAVWRNGEAAQENGTATMPGGDTTAVQGSGFVILRESLAGEEAIPPAEYLVGALAACAAEQLPPEACKAQAVLLRTNAERAAQESGSERVRYEALGQESISREEMYKRWGADAAGRLKILEAAVEDTESQTLACEGSPVWLPYFALSAGKTRNPGEIWEKQKFPYLKQVSCGEDVFAESYRQERSVAGKELQDALRQMFETDEEISWKEIILKRDSAGYVTALIWNEKKASGESFRQRLSIPSANFTIKENEKDFRIVTKGVGHGFGMSLYTAGRMAEDGQSYREILRYFFPDCEIVKN